jgi:hypothetical protein
MSTAERPRWRRADRNKRHSEMANYYNMKAEPGEYKVTSQGGSGNLSVDLKVIRGHASRAYFYVAWGFLFSIEGSIVPMFEPLKFPWNLAVYVVVIAITTWLLFWNSWVRNKLIVLKNWYENKAR